MKLTFADQAKQIWSHFEDGPPMLGPSTMRPPFTGSSSTSCIRRPSAFNRRAPNFQVGVEGIHLLRVLVVFLTISPHTTRPKSAVRMPLLDTNERPVYCSQFLGGRRRRQAWVIEGGS